MSEYLLAFVSAVLAMFWSAAPIGAAPGLALALAAVAVVTALLLTSAVGGAVTRRAAAHPWREIDASTLLGQSDPDAAGHPRPRAPGRTATAV